MIFMQGVAAGICAAEPRDFEFFEQKIRPVLAEHCYKCHSRKAEEPKGNLRLDTREGLLKGGDSGPAIVAGKPGESLLLAALRYEGPEMPPKGKLPESVVADFAAWIARGAPDPRDDGTPPPTVAGDPFEQAKSHWAYQPLRRPALPEVKDSHWPASPIDFFILAKFEAASLAPAPPADRRTLLRRVYYDLIGLPPTWEKVEAFSRDESPDAYERVVDRLLASPHYGERWGRHWLDVARYADTKDLVLVYGDDAIRPYAYTYRDYVVRALNEDTPYDQFIQEQLAAEQIDPPVEPWRLAAMGFLTLGRLYDNNPPDIYDDQIDVVTRGLLGLTVACARCHDHKYDAIPTEDYYSLYGVFANSQRPIESPRIDESHDSAAEFEAKAAPKRAELKKLIDDQYRQITETARRRTADYLTKIASEKPDPLETAVFYLSLSPDDLKPQLLASWRRYLEQRSSPDDPVFGLWSELLAIAEDEFASQAPQVVERWQEKAAGLAAGQINPQLQQALRETTLAGRGDVAALYGELMATTLEEMEEPPGDSAGASLRSDPATLEVAARKQLAAILTGEDGPLFFPKTHAFLYMPRVERGAYENLLQELDKLAVADPSAPPRAMTLADSEQIREPHVFIRGNPRQPGEQVPRRFLKVLSGKERNPFTHGAGRLDLARAISSPDNPLTARVMVNRVWMHHFGEPLVSTPSDFGVRSDPPSDPELLDCLAWTFQHEGWSMKRLHRMIVLSSTYQQSSNAEFGMRNPQVASRRRLDLEAMRDTLLFISNRLDPTLYGRPVDVAGDPFSRRRTIYGLVDRQNLPGMYRAFDFANPDQSADRRPNTTTPQQALFGLNSPFMIEQAKGLAGRREIFADAAVKDRICALYRLVFAREPAAEEIAAGARFLEAAETNAGQSQLSAWEQYAQVLLLTNELMFVD